MPLAELRRRVALVAPAEVVAVKTSCETLGGVQGRKLVVFDLILGLRASPGARGESFDTEALQGGTRSLSFCSILNFWVVFRGLPAGFPTLPALF